MATKQARGTKRTCQNDECGARFYDLARDPITCPVCNSHYELASSPLALQAVADEKAAARRGAKKPEFVAEKRKIDDPEAIVSEDALDNVEEAEEAVVADDETFLEEEEEEGGDLSTVIGGPVDEGEEEV